MLNSFDTLASHLYTTFIALSTALALRGTPEKAEATQRHHGVSRTFFAVALGPTVGTAKSRVIVAIDGLEKKVWGLREGDIDKAIRTGDVSEGGEDNAWETESNTNDEDKDEQSDGEESEWSSEEEEQDTSGSDDAASPPPSRSPSPSSSSDADSSPSTSPPNVPKTCFSSPAENPETIRAAERLLSRTLASACAEDDGQGLAAEMGKPNS